MAKLHPQERWGRHVMERFTALKQSGKLDGLGKRGLAILKRQERYTPEEWNGTFSERAYSQEFRSWFSECEELGKQFGLAPWTVGLACLLKDYRPEATGLVMEASWPEAKIVTECEDPVFVARLTYEAQRLGLRVVVRQGSFETACIMIITGMLEPPPQPSSWPPRNTAFAIKVETPIGYQPEAARDLHKQADRVGRELLRRMGYSVPARLRASSLVSMAEDLKVGEGPLQSGGIYDIIDKVHGEDDLTADGQRRNTIKNRRHKLKKRLVDPYGAEKSQNMEDGSTEGR